MDTLGGGGIALGVLARPDLRSERILVQPGDVLTVYSDGVTEATSARRLQQGAERMINVLKENRYLFAQEILGANEEEMRFVLEGSSAQTCLVSRPQDLRDPKQQHRCAVVVRRIDLFESCSSTLRHPFVCRVVTV